MLICVFVCCVRVVCVVCVSVCESNYVRRQHDGLLLRAAPYVHIFRIRRSADAFLEKFAVLQLLLRHRARLHAGETLLEGAIWQTNLNDQTNAHTHTRHQHEHRRLNTPHEHTHTQPTQIHTSYTHNNNNNIVLTSLSKLANGDFTSLRSTKFTIADRSFEGSVFLIGNPRFLSFSGI